MVCCRHFKAKYARFLIQYHCFILICVLIMTSICSSFMIYKFAHRRYFQAHLRGFQAHGTKSSDDYRKFIALIQETHIAHLYPHSADANNYQQTPYSSFNPHINPCKNRFYLPSCPILPYIELTFEFSEKNRQLFDNRTTFRSICHLEWTLRNFYTNCSTNSFCCQLIGPVELLFDDQWISSEQCDNITEEQLIDFHHQWLTCQNSCSNMKLMHYLSTLDSDLIFKIFLSLEGNSSQLIHLYEHFFQYHYEDFFRLKSWNFNSNDEEILLGNLFEKNSSLIYLTLIFYIFSLIFFVKNFFFIFILVLHILSTTFLSFLIYDYFLHLPFAILNVNSFILYLFLVLIDAFLWYSCWFINHHRRDDCTIQRIIENLLTQTFFYILPKNLTAIIVLVITYTNQILAIQYFIVLAFLFIGISFVISFTIYPASFIFILRYQSSIPTIERFSSRILIHHLSVFLDRTIPYLIIRFKAVWLTLFTLLSCCALLILFQWPKLQFDVCRITFDTLPSSSSVQQTSRTIDIDLTYYMGSTWEIPTESFLPMKDIPKLEYTNEDKLSTTTDGPNTFVHTLKNNLSQLFQLCSTMKERISHQSLSSMTMFNHSVINLSNLLPHDEILHFNSFDCFGDLSIFESNHFSNIETKFSPYIDRRHNFTNNCRLLCQINQTKSHSSDCIFCLSSNYYHSKKFNDLFLIKNGLRFKNDGTNPRYLFQTINYQWHIRTHLNNYNEWENLLKNINEHFLTKFYSKFSKDISFWFTSEIFSTWTILEQLQQEKFSLIAVKFLLILIFLLLFTGILGIFVTLTTFLNFLTCIATLTLLDYRFTIENLSHFVIVLIICLQYSVLYSISYKLAPTFFFQRENRTMYSLRQLCTTLFHLTISILLICSPCLFSSLPYLFKTALIYLISSSISFFYSTFFLQSLFCAIGPGEHSCCFPSWRLTFTRNFNMNKLNNNDISLRNSSMSSGTRRHRRMSTSSHFASSYFSQIFTGSTYFESEYGGLTDSLTGTSRRRESSRSHQTAHAIKRNSLLTGELIELYTPRASLAPYSHHHHHHHHRYSRQSSVPRTGPALITPARPMYVSPSASPHSQLSIHSQITARQQTPSPQIPRPSRSPSPHSFVPVTNATVAARRSLRPCYSAPRLHVPIHRLTTTNIRPTGILLEETSLAAVHQPVKRSVMIIQRQNAITSTDDSEHSPTSPKSNLSAATRRNMLKETTVESTGSPVWLKRSNSS